MRGCDRCAEDDNKIELAVVAVRLWQNRLFDNAGQLVEYPETERKLVSKSTDLCQRHWNKVLAALGII